MAATAYAQKYYDALIANYDILIEAMKKATERGLKVSAQLAEDIAKGQRDALELGRKLATEQPADMAQLYGALMEATTAAQGRALAFTQVAYAEALGAGTDTRETVQKLVEANKDTAKAAVDLARTFATQNPFADAIRKNFEAFAPKKAEAAKA